MKVRYIAIILAVISFTACNSNSNKEGSEHHDTADTTAHSHDAGIPETAQQKTAPSFKSDETIADYLQLKNALAADNSNDAAEAGKKLNANLFAIDNKSLSEEQQKTMNDVLGDAQEHAEHIGANAGNIKHQREHFEMLSKDIADIIKTFGNGGRTLYKDFCPMASEGKGAIWISEVKEIKNPYLGNKMPTCGSVKEELK
ncbi:MAG: DUF3347 domain-containing protein [Ferruginibacter sp.]